LEWRLNRPPVRRLGRAHTITPDSAREARPRCQREAQA